MASRSVVGCEAASPSSGLSIHRIRRVTLGALSNVLAQVINSMGQFVTVPVLLTAWGKELYGEWLTLSAAVGYLTLVDFGLQTYVVNLSTQCWAREDQDKFRRIYGTAVWAAASVSGAAALLCAILAGFLPIGEWLNFTVSSPKSVTLVITLLAGMVILSVPYGIVNGVYRSLGDYARGQMINNLRLAASFVAMMVAASSGWGLAGAAASQIVVLVAIYVVTIHDVRRRHPAYVTHLPKPDVGLAMSFIMPSVLFLVIQISSLFSIQGSTLLVGVLHGAVGVGVFVTLRTLANVLKQVAATVYHALWPEFTAMQARCEYKSLWQLHQFGAKLSMGTAFLLALWLHFNGAAIVNVWTGGRIDYDAVLMDGLLVLLISECLWFGSSLVLSSANNHRRMSVIVPVSKVLGLLLAGLLGGAGWLAGVSWGLAATDIAFCASAIPVLACKVLHQSFWEFAKQVLFKAIAPMFLTAAIATFLAAVIPDNGWMRFLGTAGAIAVAGSLASYFLWFDYQEREKTRAVLSYLPIFERMIA